MFSSLRLDKYPGLICIENTMQVVCLIEANHFPWTLFICGLEGKSVISPQIVFITLPHCFWRRLIHPTLAWKLLIPSIVPNCWAFSLITGPVKGILWKRMSWNRVEIDPVAFFFSLWTTAWILQLLLNFSLIF